MSFPEWISPKTGAHLRKEGDGLRAGNGEVFPVIDAIPRFCADGYSQAFGSQWNRFPRTQLDSHTGLPLSQERLEHCLGASLLASLKGKNVLEAGCGAGRFTEILLKQGAAVTSIDLSSAVDANARNFPVNEQHRIAQADIAALPFEPQQYDVVVCLGVLQHTPSPEDSIAHLYRQVKPGGTLAIDHYTHERARWSSVRPLFRAWLKRVPQEKRWRAVDKLVDVFLPWHQRFRSFYPAWFLLCRISPITTYYRTFPELREELQREFALLDTHDSLTDWYKHLRTTEQIAGTLRKLGGEDVQAWYGGNGVEARCRRPLA